MAIAVPPRMSELAVIVSVPVYIEAPTTGDPEEATAKQPLLGLVKHTAVRDESTAFKAK